MPSTVSGLTQYLIAGAAKEFAYRIAPLNAFSNATVQDGCMLNDIVRIPFVTGSTSQTFAYATGYNTANSYVNGVSVTMDTWKYQLANITDADLVRLSPESITAIGQDLGNRLAADVISAVLLNTGSFANHVASSGSLWASATAPVDVRLSGSLNRWPVGQQSLILAPALYNKILTTTNAAAHAYGNASAIQDGKLPRYYGFDLYEVDSVPTTVNGLAVTPAALGVALSYPVPQPGHNYIDVQRLTDPSGAVLGYRKFYDPVKGTMSHVFECLFGTAVLNSAGAFNLKVTNINL